MRISWKRFAICIGIQSIISVGTFFSRGIVSAQTTKDILRCLNDGFFLGGALMVLSSGLVWTAGQGVADGLTYSIGRFFGRRGPGYEENRREDYAHYKERKHAKKPQILEMLLAGILYVAVAVVLLIPYSCLS